MNLVTKQSIFMNNVSLLIKFIHDQQYLCTFGEAYRTPEQAKIYADSGKGIIDSLHCKRLAIDLNLFTPDGNYLDATESYMKIGQYWEGLDPLNRWGGRFKRADGNHFEMQDK